MRIAATASTLGKWGYPCANEGECGEGCTGGTLYDVEWDTCPIGEARKSRHLRVLRAFQRQRRVCGTLSADALPAWVIRDLDLLTQLEVQHGADSRTE